MSALLNEIIDILKWPATDPTSTIEVAVMWILMFTACTACVSGVGKSLKSAMAYSIVRDIIITLSTFALIAAGMAVFNLHILPNVKESPLRLIAPALIIAALVTGVAAPLCKQLHKTKYSKAVTTIILCLVCASGTVLLTRAGFKAARNSSANAMKMKERTDRAGELE